jgi:Lar family restriction alleviation protein
METIKECPFCGSKSVEVLTESEINDTKPSKIEEFAVVCMATKGGCGASSGYSFVKKEAVKKWNKRKEDEEVNKQEQDKDE